MCKFVTKVTEKVIDLAQVDAKNALPWLKSDKTALWYDIFLLVKH